MLTKAELVKDGCVPNGNMWIGSGWLFCGTCRQYRKHEAWSHVGSIDCFELCLTCQTYTGSNRLNNADR